MISSNTQRVLGAVAAVVLVAGISAGAMAETRWQQNHPRRVEFNHRLDNQNARIQQERREGEISRAQAVALHSADHQIRMEERGMAASNGGHITAGEQHMLNAQENAVSAHIGH